MGRHSKSQSKKDLPPLSKADILCDLNSDTYYSGAKFMSYNVGNLISLGGRGIGKTTWYLGYAVNRYIKTKEQFVYFRRYKPEVKDFVTKDSMNGVIANCCYISDGTGGYDVIHGDERIGFILPISSAKNYKSTKFDMVGTIIYDEAIIMETNTSHYITKEVESYLEFSSTIQRTRTNVKSIILGNNLDLFNPYFRYFNVPMFESRYFNGDRGLFCEKMKPSAKLLELEKQTPLYKLTKGTPYHLYHYDNEVLGTDNVSIMNKPKDAKILARLKLDKNLLNLYTYNNREGRIFCEQRQRDYTDNITYVLLKNGEPNYYYSDLYKNKLKMFVRRLYCNDCVDFNNKESGAMLKWVVNNI